MCLLIFVPSDVQPTEEHLRKGAENNPDGHGYAIVHNDQLIVRKSMEPDTLIDSFMRLRSKYPDGPAMFHSRISTAGLIDKRNCHPFTVGNDPRTVVAHNGILPAEAQPRKGDRRCDTRIFAEQLLPQRNFDGHKSMRKLSRWLRGDKVVILTTNPRWNYRAYILNQDYGEWEGGCWYSNNSHQEQYYSWRFDTHSYPTLIRRKCLVLGCANMTYLRECSDCRLRLHGSMEAIFAGNCQTAGCPNETTSQYCHECDWTTTASPVGLATRSPDECSVCGAYGTVSIVTHVCTACNTCQDCGEEAPGLCLCYVPAQLDREDQLAGSWPTQTSALALPAGNTEQ